MDEQELLDAYHDRHPFSYGSKKTVKDFVNIRNEDLEKVLAQSDIYILITRSFRDQKFHRQ